MKKFLILIVLLISHHGFATELCTNDQIKILEDQKFVGKFLDKYKLDECHSVEIYKKRSDRVACIANIKIVEKAQTLDGQFPYLILSCN